MAIRYVRMVEIIQKDPTGKPIDGAPNIGLKELWEGTLANDSRVTANFKAIRTAHNIADAFAKPRQGKQHKWAIIPDSDYDLLKAVAEEPHGLRKDKEPGYPGGIFTQIFPLLQEIMEARTDEPDDLKE